jgi:hypothetical protein
MDPGSLEWPFSTSDLVGKTILITGCASIRCDDLARYVPYPTLEQRVSTPCRRSASESEAVEISGVPKDCRRQMRYEMINDRNYVNVD